MPIDIELIEDGESGLSVRQKLNTLIEGAASGSLGTPLPPGVGDTTPPAVPTGLTVTSAALPRSTMLIEWNLNTETDFAFYDLQVKKEFGHWVSYQTSADAHVLDTTANTNYSVRIRAVDRSGNASEFCDIVAHLTSRDEVPPATPIGVSATGGLSVIWLLWTPNSEDDLSHYEIFESSTTTTPTADADATYVAEGHSFSRAGFGDGVTRHFWVRAVDTSGNKSPWSTRVEATTVVPIDVDAPETPTGLAVTSTIETLANGTQRVKLNASCTANGEADLAGYIFEVKEGAGNYVGFSTNTNSYEWPLVKPGVAYTVRVSAFDKLGNKSAPSAGVAHTAGADTNAPATPAGVTADGGFGFIALRWTKNSEADLSYYEIYQHTASTPAPTAGTAATFTSASNALNITGLAPNTTRHYWVRAVDTSGNKSAWSSRVQATTVYVTIPNITPSTIGTPGVPSLSASSALASDGGVVVTLTADWTAASNAVAYEIGITEGGGGEIVVGVASLYHAWAARAGVLYSVRVRGINELGGKGPWTTAATLTPGGDTTAPGVPTGLAATPGFNTIWLSWAQVAAADLSHYEIYIHTAATPAPVAGTAATHIVRGTTFVHQGLANGAQRWYWVRAVDLSGNKSAWTASVNATTTTITIPDITDQTLGAAGVPTLTPTVVTDAHGNVSVQIEAVWTAATNAVSYEVGIKEGAGNEVFFPVGDLRFRFAGRPGILYTVRVRPISKLGAKGSWTTAATVTPAGDTTPPAAPTSLSAIAGLDTVWLSWVNPADTDFSHVEIFENTVNNSGTATKIGEARGTSASRTVSLEATRYYWLKAVDTSGNKSAFSSVASATTGSIPQDIQIALESVLFTPAQSGGNRLTWTAGSIAYGPNGAAPTTQSISAGFVDWTSGTIYVYYVPGNTALSTSTSLTTVYSSNGLIVGIYKGGTNFQLVEGRAAIDGALILAQTIGASQLVTGSAVITGSAQIANAIIGTAHVSSISAAKLEAGTALAGSITVSGTALSTVTSNAALGAQDPAARINAASTQIDPGKILISGAKSLADWRMGGDETKINGGEISVNTIDVNKLVVGLRNVRFTDIQFEHNSPGANQVSWTSGWVRYINDTGVATSVAISAGNATWSTGILFVYWVKGASTLSTTGDVATALGPDNVTLASYRGGTNLVTDYGRTVIDGAFIKTGTVDTVHLKANSVQAAQIAAAQINATHVGANQIVTQAANIADAIITSAKILSLDAGKIQAGTALAGSITVSGTALSTINTNAANGQAAFSKFSGAGGTLPAGNVEFNFAGSSSKGGNATNTEAVGSQGASTVATAVLNFNGNNDRIATTPANPVVLTDGTAVDHTINTDGSANISFEWSFTGTGDAYDIDGFIVYVRQSTSASAYTFGTSAEEEQVFYVTPEKRAFILHGVPADQRYTFGVQAYRIVDTDVDASGAKKSAIVKSTRSEENPYRPAATVAFGGDITGTLNGSAVATVVSNAALGAQDPAARINAASTQIDPGKILISGGTSLSNWIKAGDTTKIDGGQISANTILANSAIFGLRGLTIDSLQFEHNSPSANSVSWTAGSITYTNDAGSTVTQAISAGNAAWTTGTLYIYYVQGGTTLSTTTTAATANAPNAVILATYKGGTNLVTNYGRTIIDGSNIKTGTITATQADITSFRTNILTANVISATMLQSNIITAKHMVIGSNDNLVPNGDFADGTNPLDYFGTPSGSGALSYSTTYTKTGARSLNLAKTVLANSVNSSMLSAFYIPVTPGEVLFGETEVMTDGTATGVGFYYRVLFYQTNKTTAATPGNVDIATNQPVGTSWTPYSKQITVPSDAAWARIQIYNHSTQTTTANFFIDRLVLRRANTASLIVNGTITGDHLNVTSARAAILVANSITASMISVSNLAAISATLGAVDISAANIGTLQVGTANIANAAITSTKTQPLEVIA